MSEPLRILLVEDNEDDAELVVRFARQNFPTVQWLRVETETQMRDALGSSKWDLVMADYHLPTFSGPEAIKTLRGMTLDLPLIIVSGTVGEDTAIEALKMGATDYVLKSNLGRLPSAIERALRETQDRREKKETEQQLIQAQKMETIGRLAGGVAHDVNNVLAAITLFAEMAVDQISNNETAKATKSLEGIIKAQESAASIIRQLLLFSRRRVGPTGVVDFASVLTRIQSLIGRLVGEEVELKIENSLEPLPVSADETQIEQIVLNLAVNARDAMPKGGKLTLSLEPQNITASPPTLRIPLQPGRYVVLTATDTGSGMPPEVFQKLFEPFFTTKEPGKGTGLGLSVIFGILRQAGGSVAVQSTPGAGTTFQIYWPISTRSATQKQVQKTTEPAPNSKPVFLLLVEDDPELREILAATLRKQGHSVVEASHGQEGLARVSQRQDQIGLLITDIIMPGMNGPELAKQARLINPKLSVLFLSGYIDNSLESINFDSQLTYFLEKPFSSQTLSNKVTEVLTASGSSVKKLTSPTHPRKKLD